MPSDPTEGPSGIAANQLRSFIERVERIEEERAALGADLRDIYAEAKANGFDTKAMRRIVSLRKKDESQRREEEATLELYMQALNMSS